MYLYHSDRRDWYRAAEQVLWIARGYYQSVRYLIRSCPELRQNLTRCVQCRIYFLTSSSNKGRTDLRCPFGCREVHCRKRSNKRSKQHYQTNKGRSKKKQLNRNRSLLAKPWVSRGQSTKDPNPQSPWSFKLLRYLSWIVSKIEPVRPSDKDISNQLKLLLESILRRRPLPIYDG
jgi:hypothetical protein